VADGTGATISSLSLWQGGHKLKLITLEPCVLDVGQVKHLRVAPYPESWRSDQALAPNLNIAVLRWIDGRDPLSKGLGFEPRRGLHVAP
jgi:hypothetical protein